MLSTVQPSKHVKPVGFVPLLLLCVPLTVYTKTVIAAPQAQLDLGLGLGSILAPDYLGADEQQQLTLPFVYVRYQSNRINIDRDGFSGLLFRHGRFHLDLNAGVSLPVDSEENTAREGMEDLDPTLELGPALEIALDTASADARTQLILPIRAVIATDLRNTSHEGWVFHPHVQFNYHGFTFSNGLEWEANLGPLWADREYHQYYYSVKPAEATATRPAYTASSGFSGIRFSTSFTYREKSVWFAVYVRVDDLHNTDFIESPLVKDKTAVTGGFAWAWIFSQRRF